MIGKVLGNRYEILEQIGGGGMALVYKAKCRLLDRFVAIKILRDEFTNDEDFIRKFRRESQAAASLSHPNIMNIYDVGVEEDGDKKIYYIVMEFINGKTLKEVIQEKGKLTVDETLYYSIHIAEALQHAHNNHIVHRDIKPHNIMVTMDNRVKVTDFGIARAVTSSTVTTTSNVLGSVHYFSPEQARGGYTDEKSDIYSLGIVMYEMITGKLPFEADSPISVALKHVQEEIVPPRDLDETIPFGLEAIILKCVQKRQSDRYANIADLLADLKSIKSYGQIGSNGNNNDFDSNTRLIPKVEIEDGVLDKVGKTKPKNKKKKDKKDGSLMIIFSAILLAFLLVTISFMGYAKIKGFLSVEEVPVPKLTGMEESEAENTLKDLGLLLKVNARVKSTEYAPGQIVSQDVSENMNVKKGSSIGVTVSEGQDSKKVPLVINKSLTEAEELIKAAGFKMGVPEYAYDETVPVDFVISQDPDAFAERQPGTKITLVVSQGTEIKPVFMPKVVGMPINEARKALVALDLIVGEVKTQPSNEFAPDIVSWQEYEQGTELESKTSVDLYISSGPEPVVEEPVEPVDEMGSITFTFTPLADRDETEIKVFLKHDGVTEVIYNKMHKASDGEVVKTFTGKVGSQVEVHYDGIFQGIHTITKE